MQTNEEGNTMVTGIMHSSRLGMIRNKKVVVHKMNNITDEVLSWVKNNVKFCDYCSCTLVVDTRSEISCQPHFVKTFPQDIDDHCPGLLNDEIDNIVMKHQDITTFTLESVLRFKNLRELDFSFNNLTELPQIDKPFKFHHSDSWVHFNFSHNLIAKTNGFFDMFRKVEGVDLSSNPTTTIFTQSPVIANRIQHGYIELGNFTTYFGNENEVRPILDKYCTHRAYWGHYQAEECIPAEGEVLDLLKCHNAHKMYSKQYYRLIKRRCWVQFNPAFQVLTFLISYPGLTYHPFS